jgi:hypothetical protein
MRIFKPTTTAAIAAAAALALAPAGASARHGHAPPRHAPVHHAPARPAPKHPDHKIAGVNTSCKVTSSVAPHVVEAGESTEVFGQLTCSGGRSVANQAVTVTERPAGSAASSAGTATTNAAGQYQLTSPALTVNTGFYATALGVRSREHVVRVAPTVTLVGPPDGAVLYTGRGPILPRTLPPGYRPPPGFRNTVTFTGTVSPADTGALVVLQRQNASRGDQWYRIGTSTVGAGGAFTIVHTFSVPGDSNLRVIVRPTPGLDAAGVSETLSYEISQAQNLALTILSSAEPVSYGQPVTITGTVAAGPGASLTLLERSHGAAGWVAVAKTTSTTGGAYAFPARTPTRSVLFQVTGAGQTSAQLFEGVRYVISAATTASTVIAGQPLSFTGSVIPGVPGQTVYLEVLGPRRLAWHVVEVGTVRAADSFSIVHSQFVPGMRTYRIRVPGSPEYLGTSGPEFTVNVTPAPLGTLRPEGPGNTSAPPEGQL